MMKQILYNVNKCEVTFHIKINEGKGLDFTSYIIVCGLFNIDFNLSLPHQVCLCSYHENF